MAPTMRWRMPPDISCGYCRRRVSGEAMRTAFKQIERPPPGGCAIGALVHPNRLRHLVADGEERIEGGHRILQDHGDTPAAQTAHFRLGFLQQVLAFKQHRCRWRSAPRAAAGARTLSASVLLPEPDSPTMPKVSRAPMLRLTPSTARITRVPRAET